LSKKKPGPSDSDLQEAFELADLDDNGHVELQEFMYLYALVEAGQVTGIGKGSFTVSSMFSSSRNNNDKSGGSNKKEKGESKAAKREKFLEQLQEKREARSSGSFRQNIVLPRDVITYDNTGAAEMAILSQVNARRETATALSSAKDAWESRGENKMTSPQDIGNLGKPTKSSKNKYVEVTRENTGHAELDIKNMKNARDNAALVLTEAKDAWESRENKLTSPDDIGRLDKLTVAATNRVRERGSVEQMSDAEKHKLDMLKGREHTSLALTSAREEWERRDKITIPDFMGNVANKTRSSRNKSVRMTAENTPSAELDLICVRNARMISSISLTNAKSEWENRSKVYTPVELGNAGNETAASKARNEYVGTVDNTGAQEYILKQRNEARNLISEDLSNAKKEWEVRAQQHQEETGSSSVYTVAEEFKDAGKHTEASRRYMDKESKVMRKKDKEKTHQIKCKTTTTTTTVGERETCGVAVYRNLLNHVFVILNIIIIIIIMIIILIIINSL
jgi:hypothetical protein